MKPFPKSFFMLALKYAKVFKYELCFLLFLMIASAYFFNLNVRYFADITGSMKLGDLAYYEKAMRLLVLLSISSVLGVFFSRFSKYFLDIKLVVKAQARMEEDLFAYLLGHSVKFISERQVGMLIKDKEQVKELPSLLETSFDMIKEILDLIVKVMMLTIISPYIGGLYFIAVFIVVAPSRLFNKLVVKTGALTTKITALVNGRILDIINNIKIVKQFDSFDYEKKNLNILFKQEYDMKIRSFKAFFVQYTVVGLTVAVATFLILLLAIYLWCEAKIKTSDIVFILITLTQGLNMMAEIQFYLLRLKQKIASVEQALKPFTIAHEIVDAPNACPLKVKKGKIEFKNICFGYHKKKTIFKDFSLTIENKEKVGIVGSSGCGKSTLIQLLTRNYELNAGEILIDGQNISLVTQKSLKKNISIIAQDSLLFNRTFFENIAFGTDTATLSLVKSVAKKALAHDFICSKENGYDEYVGDRGIKLSGGERQRIAIARAIIKNAPILILDEASSALDSESENIINKALENVITNQTVIAIAHRLSTLKNMDRIVVIDKGKIVESGKFDELLKIKGKFFELYQAETLKGGKHV